MEVYYIILKLVYSVVKVIWLMFSVFNDYDISYYIFEFI